MAELLKITYQYRLHLTKGQQRLLEQQLEECRHVYNQTLAVRREAWEQRQQTLGLYDTQALLPEWKAERPSLKLVYSQVLQNVQMRVDLAFKAFFRRVKMGESEAGYPRFKGYGRYDSMTYPQYGNGARLEGKRLILSKIGAVQINLHRPVKGRIKTVTLRRSSTGKWFVAFAVERERTAVADRVETAVGVDVGLEKFATLSTGETIDNQRFFRGDEKDTVSFVKGQFKITSWLLVSLGQIACVTKRHTKCPASHPASPGVAVLPHPKTTNPLRERVAVAVRGGTAPTPRTRPIRISTQPACCF